MFTFTLSGGWVSDRPYPQRFQAAKDLGFEAIEMLEWRGEDLSAARAEIDRTRRSALRHSLPVGGPGYQQPH